MTPADEELQYTEAELSEIESEGFLPSFSLASPTTFRVFTCTIYTASGFLAAAREGQFLGRIRALSAGQ